MLKLLGSHDVIEKMKATQISMHRFKVMQKRISRPSILIIMMKEDEKERIKERKQEV